MIAISKDYSRALFEEQALDHWSSIYNSAMYFTRNEKDAEDLTQETYLKAFRKYFQFEQGTNIKAWLQRILANTFFNTCRKKKDRQVSSISDNAEFLSPVTSDAPLANEFDLDDFQRFEEYISDELKSALDSLPYEYRSVMLLITFYDLSYKEISQKLGIPIGTVMSRLHRSREMLQRHLKHYAVAQ
ncbi:MAG: sigma-70 family RNA polymerase sigma factor [Planctomycetes bacterium]|nr:sigma-70 family RNA polymerase sigma factor [Planctomycetota bacterium]